MGATNSVVSAISYSLILFSYSMTVAVSVLSFGFSSTLISTCFNAGYYPAAARAVASFSSSFKVRSS